MSISTMAQIGSAATNLIFVIVIAIGYVMMIRLYRQMVKVYERMTQLMEEQSTSMGRPLIIVYEDPDKLPNVDLVIQNVGPGPAKDISFEFSAPIQSSDGFVLSELPIFQKGITSLAPGTKVTCYWDNLANLLSDPQTENGVDQHIEVTTHYKNLAEASYETRWEIQPSVYKGVRNIHHKSMTDLVNAVEGISEDHSGEAEDQAAQDGTRSRADGETFG
jgi:hypothetical protein